MLSRAASSLLRVVCFALLTAGTASAATVTSNTGFGLDWNTPATWQGGQVPASGDDVVIAPGSSVTIAAATTVNVNSVTVQGGVSVSPSESGGLTVDGTLNVTNAATAQGGTPGGAADIIVNGVLNAGAVNVNGGAGDANGTGGAATLSLNASTAAVTVGGDLSVTVVNGAFAGGAATVNFPATGGMLDVNGNLNVTSGTLNLSNGSVELAGNFIGDYLETISAGGSTITLNGTAHQQWIGNNHTLWNLTVTNASADVLSDAAAVTLDSDITVGGVLTMSGGTIYNSFNLVVSQVGGLTHNSGHIRGSLVRNVAGATPALFPVGTAIPLFATVTPSSSGLLQVLVYEGIAWGAGANAIDAYWELIGDQTLTNIDAVTFNYGGTTVTGTEGSYVIARQDYTASPAMWYRYTTTLDTTNDVASMTTNTPLLGYWTIAEPSAVTTATQLVLSSVNYGITTRQNTPFDLVYEAQDGQGNPATFSQYSTFELQLGPSTPAPTGTLTDVDGNLAPIGADANAGDQYLYIYNVLYTAAETVNLQVSDTSATFAAITTPVTFDVPAAGLTITSTADDGPGTLRHAIHTVNHGGCSTTPCPVDFQLPVAEQLFDGTWSIEIQSSSFANSTIGRPVSVNRIAGVPLPGIFSAMTIDATTQSGYNAADPKPVVGVNFNGGNGLVVDGSGTTIRGLALHHAADQAIVLQGSGNHIVEGCYLGLYASGASDNDTATGIAVTSSNNTIGGTSAAQRNVISGNWFGGIELLAGATQNQILGNYIGTDPAGTTAVPNFNGIVITGASSNMIGGAQAGAGNVIAGNDSDGILIDGTTNNNAAVGGGVTTNVVVTNAAQNKLEGNAIGYGANGAELPNSYAVTVQGDGALDNVVGGPSAGQGNSIGGGIHLQTGSLGTAILGNTTDITAAGIIVSGFTGNDAGDGDINTVTCFQAPCVYANNGQNTPEISAATLVNTTLQVTATVDSSAVTGTQSIRVEVFAADASDTLTLIGNGCYDTNFPSNVTINIPNAAVAAGDQIYATATSFTTTGCAINDQSGNHLINDGTSQFSAPATVSACVATTPTITASGPTSFCDGGSVTLTASTGSSYSWKKDGIALNVFSQQLAVNTTGSYSVVVTDGNGCPAESAATTVTVFANPPMPPIGADSATTFCQGGSVVLRTSPGATSYQWFHNDAVINGATSDAFTATAGGSYTVAAFDANGCSATSSAITVTVNPAPATPTISPSGPTTFCAGGNVVLTSSQATTYQWLLNGSPIQNATAQTFTASATGNYSVVAGDGSCTATSAAIAVTVNPAPATPTVTPNGPTSFCTGGSVVLTSSTASSYQWLLNGSPIQNATAQSFTATATGNYSVTVFDANTCSATSAAVTVTVNAAPATPVITPSGPTTFCQGSNVVLTSSQATTYQWLLNSSPIQNATGQTFTASATGNYSVVAGNGSCTATSAPTAVTVNPTPATPTVTPNGPTSFCTGGSVVLTSSPASSYQWLLNGGPIQNATAQTFTATAGGNYSVTIFDANTCSATSAAVTVTVTAPPATPVITPSGPTTFCQGSNVVLTSSAASAYQWLLDGTPIQNATAQSFTATATGNYSVVAGSGSCTATSAPVAVTVQSTATPAITAGGPTTFCQGGSVTLTASATTGTYQWLKNGSPIGGANAQTYVASVTGNFTVTVTENNCPATSAPVAVTVTPFTPALNAPSTTICPGGSVTLSASAGTAYQWYFNHQPINGATAQTYAATQPGDYKVFVENNGCSNFSAPVTLTAADATTPAITASGPTTFCDGGQVTLSSTAAPSYQWNRNGTPIPNATQQTYAATAGGSYTVTTTSSGCPLTSAPVAVTVNPKPFFTIVAPDSVTPGSSGNTASIDSVQGGVSYSWSITGGTIDGAATGTSITFTAGSDTVVLTVVGTLNGCTSTQTKQIATAAVFADLSVTKSGPASVEAGAVITYTIVATNNGPAAAANIYLTDVLPTGMAFIDADSSWPCVLVGGSVVCRTALLPAGASETIHITASAPRQAGTITNSVSINSDVADPAVENNDDAATTIVTAPAPTCATEPPSLLSPVDGASVTSPATFSWTAAAGATSYELWTIAGTATTLAGTTQNTSLSVDVPSGTVTWYVIARLAAGCDALVSAQRTVTVAQTGDCSGNGTAQLTAPLPGTVVSSPVTFAWNAVPNATGYRVWISVDGGAAQDIASTTGATTVVAAVPAGTIAASIETLFSGCPPARSNAVTFTVPKADPCTTRTAATPVAPSNGATIQSSSIDFRWTAAAGAKEYRLWAAIDGGAPAVLGTTTATELRATIARGDVLWWVESLYTGCASTESQRFRFTIPAAQNCGTERPQTLAPAGGATVGTGSITFTWSAVAGAIGYELWLSHNDGTPALIGTTTATSMPAEVPAGTLEWFVRVLVDRCPPRDSQTSRFTYTQPAGCDTNVRPAPAAPVDNAAAVSPVDFTWGASAGATRYELYVARGNSAPSLAATTSATHAGGISLANGSIRWFVRAHFAANCPPLDSAEQQLVIVPRPDACAVPNAPVLSAPGQITSGTPFRIQWSPDPAATAYHLQLSSRDDFAGAELITTSATEHDLLETNSGTAPVVVYARVRAVNSRCATAPVSAFGSAIAVFILPPSVTDGGATSTDRGQVRYTIPIGPELAGQSFVATSAQPFITFQPASGIVPTGGMNLVILVDTSSLPAGTTLGSVTLSFSTPGAGRVTTNATTVTTPISVSLVSPITPTPKNTPPPDALIIPAVAHANGINSQFQSDIRVSNTSPQLIKYQLTFTPSGDAGISAGRQTTFSIDPGRTVALDDVLKSWFGTGTQSVTGTLEVRPLTQTASSTSSALVGALANLTTFASSRTFNVTPNGTYGQFIPAVPFANFIGKSGAVLSLQQIAQSSKYRTNLGLVEGSGEPASLLVKVFGANGQKLTEFPVSLNGGQHLQLNAVLATQNLGTVDDGRIEVQVTGGNGKVTAYASVLDNHTSDPLLVTPVTLGDAGNTKWVVPGVADINNGAANWQSDVRLFNAGTAPADVTLSFHSMSGGAPKTAAITLQPGEVRQLDRALSSVFGVTQNGGALHIDTATAARLIATARTYNQTSQGTYGQFISAVTPSESVAVGSRPLQLLQVEESARFRSNIGLAEVTGKPVTLEVSVIPPDSKFTATTRVTLAPNEFRQITSMLASLGLGETYNARITVRAVDGEGRATAYASVIDLKTQDPTYVPAQ